MHESIDIRLRTASRQDLPLTGTFEEEDIVELHTGAVVTVDIDINDETEVGWGSFYIVRLGVALNSGINAFQACDALSQDLMEYASAVLDPATGAVQEEIMEQLGYPPGDLLILHMLEMLPAFRGWNIGLLAAQQIIDYHGNGLVLLRPQPLQFLDATQRREYYDEMEYSRFLEPREMATRKIRDHWAQLGFKPVDNGDFLALNATLVRDRVTLRRVGPTGSAA